MISVLFDMIPEGIGMGFEKVVLLLLFVGSLVLMASDFKVGLVGLLVVFSVDFVLMYENDLNYVPALVASLAVLVLMSFSLWASSKRGSGVVV